MRKLCVVLLLCATALLAACGDDSDSGQSGSAAGGEVAVDTGPPPTLREAIDQTFPPPEPTENAPPGSAAAIKAGREVCKGKTPLEVREEFLSSVEGDLNEGQLEMVEDLERYEKQVTPNFVAGQLAAGIYEASLPEATARGGYQGCVYELAQGVLRKLGKQQRNKQGKQQSKSQG